MTERERDHVLEVRPESEMSRWIRFWIATTALAAVGFGWGYCAVKVCLRFQ